jgi:hypothetical protein
VYYGANGQASWIRRVDQLVRRGGLHVRIPDRVKAHLPALPAMLR